MKKVKKQYLTKEDINNLTYVKVDSPNISLRNFPDFLIIGPQRTGTTWLHSNLRSNPYLFMSTPKETHYFAILSGRSNKRENKNFHPDISYYLKYFDANNKLSVKDLLKHFFKEKEQKKILARGESSATYALLNKDAINDILILNPDIKIIMLVRNPIERAWSHLKLDLINNRAIPYSHKNKYHEISDIPEEKIIKILNKEDFDNNSYFSKIIEKWLQFVEQKNFFVGNFNDIAKSPGDLLMSIHHFLGIEFDKTIFEKKINKIINKSKNLEMPPNIKSFLQQRYNDEINLLRSNYKLDV